MSSDLIATVHALFDDLAGGGDLGAVFDKYLHEDCVWENTGVPTAPNRAACAELIRGMQRKRGMTHLTTDFLRIGLGEDGESVLTERIDYMWAGTELLFDLPLAGVCVFRDGLLIHWHEYFDPTLVMLPKDIQDKIASGDLSWKTMVTPHAADQIIEGRLFGYQQ